MNICLNNVAKFDRYDDGIRIDYPVMIRLWSSFDRSIAAFNKGCGVIDERRRNSRPAHDHNKPKDLK